MYCFNAKFRLLLCEIGYCCTLMKALFTFLCLSFGHLVQSKLLKYYEYQLTKRCLKGTLEGFKVSSWFLKKIKLIEYRIAKKCDGLPSVGASVVVPVEF